MMALLPLWRVCGKEFLLRAAPSALIRSIQTYSTPYFQAGILLARCTPQNIGFLAIRLMGFMAHVLAGH